MELIIEIVLAFFLKVSDNALGTVKTIFLTKGKAFLAALFAAFSSAFYFIAIVRVANSGSVPAIVAMCVATFVGTLIPCLCIKRAEPEKLYIFDITANTLDAGKQFADILRAENIAIQTSTVYDMNLTKTLKCNVYCSTKEKSKVVLKLLNDPSSL